MDRLVGYHDYSVLVSCIPSNNMFTLVHCIGHDDDDDDDVAEALANICAVNIKLRRVQSDFISPLPVMKSLATRQVPLEELVIQPPRVQVYVQVC